MQTVSPEALYSAFRHQTTVIRTRVAPWVPHWTPVLMAALVALIAVDGEFVYDDIPSIVENPTFEPSGSFSDVWTSDIWGYPLAESVRGYRPLTNSIWWTLWQAFPGSPVPFRLLTAIAHCLATLAVVRLAALMTPKLWVVGAAGFLFAMHPIHTEALGGITWQSDVLSACLGLWGLLLCLYPLGAKRMAMASLLFLAAILTKESGFLFPFAGAVLFAVAQNKGRWSRIGLLITLGLTGFAVALQLTLNRSFGELGSNNLVYGADLGERILLGLSIVGKGSLLLIAPHRLAPSHGYAEVDLEWVTLLPYAVLGMIAGSIFLWKFIEAVSQRDKLVASALVLWMAPIVLQSGLLVTIQTDFAERLLYTSSVSASLWLATALGKIPGSIKTTLLCFVLLLALSFQYPILRSWTSNESLWERAIEVRPMAIRTQENISAIRFQQERVDEAVWHLTVGTHLRMMFPAPSPVDRVDAIEARFSGKERVLRGLGILTFPNPPCDLIRETSARLRQRSTDLSRVIRAEMVRRPLNPTRKPVPT